MQRDFDKAYAELSIVEAYVYGPYYVFLMVSKSGYKIRLAIMYDVIKDKIKVLGYQIL